MDYILDEIEEVRKRNNTAWISIVRVALHHAPEETRRIMRIINANDRKISELWRMVADDSEQ